MRKALLGAVLLMAVAIGATTLVVRSVFTSEEMRRSITAELSRLAGVPIEASSLSASAFPRLQVTLHNVLAETTPPVHADRVEVRAGLLALVRRQLDARAITSVRIANAELMTRGRKLRADAVLAPVGDGSIAIREATLAADEMRMTVEGQLARRDTLTGNLTVRANTIDADVLLAAAAQLTGSDRTGDPAETEPPDFPGQPAGSPAAGGVRVDIGSERLSLGTFSLTALDAQGLLRRNELVLEPVSFAGFGGHYKGQIAVRFEGGAPAVRWYGDLDRLDIGQVLSTLGAPDTITGVVSGDVDLTGTGTDFFQALKSVRGSARLRISDGTIRNLGLVRSVLTAASSRPQETAQNPPGSADTRFQTLAATLTISGGSASIVELQAESPEVTVSGGGGLRLDGSILTVFTAVQLSPQVSQQLAHISGRTLEPGTRLEVPATIRGSTTRYVVEVDMAEMAIAH